MHGYQPEITQGVPPLSSLLGISTVYLEMVVVVVVDTFAAERRANSIRPAVSMLSDVLVRR